MSSPLSSATPQAITFDSKEHGGDWRLALLKEIEQQAGDDNQIVGISTQFFQTLFWPKGLSYDQLSSLILDTRFNWPMLRAVETHSNDARQGLLPYLMSQIHFNWHLDYDPAIDKALHERYQPDQITCLLEATKCIPNMPAAMGSTIDSRAIAIERVACIILSNQQTLDAWIDRLLLAVKCQVRPWKGGESSDRLSQVARTTPAYQALKAEDVFAQNDGPQLFTLMLVTAFAAVFEAQRIKSSLERYTSATIYQLADSDLTGLFDIRGNLIHRAIIQGLFVNAPDILPFCKIHLKNAPLEQGDALTCAALLACAPYLQKQPYSVRSLLNVRVAKSMSSVFKTFTRHHLVGWHEDLVGLIFSNEQVRTLRARLKSESSALQVFRDLCRSTYLSSNALQKAKGMYLNLPDSVRKMVFFQCVHELTHKCGEKTMAHRGSVFSVLATLASTEQIPEIQTLVRQKLSTMVNRAVGTPEDYNGMFAGRDQLRGALRHLYEAEICSLADYGPHLKSVQALNKLASTLAIEPRRLAAHVNAQVRVQLLETDLGL